MLTVMLTGSEKIIEAVRDPFGLAALVVLALLALASRLWPDSTSTEVRLTVFLVLVVAFIGLAVVAFYRAESEPTAIPTEKCRVAFYGLWFGTWTTEKSEAWTARITISHEGTETVVSSELQGNPQNTFYAECSGDDLTYDDDSNVVKLRVQGPNNLSGRVKTAAGVSRGVMELRRSAVPQH